MIRIGIIGAGGRMGQAIANEAAAAGALVVGGIGSRGAVYGEHADAASLAVAADVLIDFSTPDAMAANLDAARAAGTPIVIGTTGLTPAHHALIDAAATTTPVLQTANTSLGVNVLRGLVEQAARMLGPDLAPELMPTLLTGQQGAADRRRAALRVASGQSLIVIGTHALLSEIGRAHV